MDFRELASGRQRTLTGNILRGLLWTFEPIYTAAVRYRNRRFDLGHHVERVPVPVVSVGNITLGGTGKTPMVEWLARWFNERGVRVALVSRGYGAATGEKNDEAKELADKLPDVPHIQNPSRVNAARAAIERHGAQLILLDDGFQHRFLHRDLDIVLIDALEPFGFDHCLPRGTLREPLSGLARAHVIALSRADAVDEKTRRAIHDRVRQYNSGALWLELTHAPRALRNSSGTIAPLQELASKRLLAFCGIGNPAGFRHVLECCGYAIAEFVPFPDHHHYLAADLTRIDCLAKTAEADAIVCTHKDLVKIGSDAIGPMHLWALEIGLQMVSDSKDFERQLGLLATEACGVELAPPGE